MFNLKAFWLFAFLAANGVSVCLAQNQTAPPACATQCASAVANTVQCGSISNTTCICNTNVQQFATLGGECIGSECSSADLDAARTYFEGLCSSQSGPGGSSSSSASGSSIVSSASATSSRSSAAFTSLSANQTSASTPTSTSPTTTPTSSVGLTTILPSSTSASAPASSQTGGGDALSKGAISVALMWAQIGVVLAIWGAYA